MRAHEDVVRDEFTKQAVPFSRAAKITDPQPVQWAIEAAAAGPRDTMLDVACGPGILVCGFAEVVRHATGIDLTPAMLGQARSLQAQRALPNVSWCLGDAARLPFPNGSFSIVTSRYAFHHVLKPHEVLAEMERVSAPGGRIVLIDVVASPNLESAAAFNRMEKLRDPSHVRTLPLPEIQSLFHQTGLTIRRQTAHTLELEVEELLQHSFPQDGDIETVRRMILDSLETGFLGIDIWRDDHKTRLAYPVVIVGAIKRLF